MRNLEN